MKMSLAFAAAIMFLTSPVRADMIKRVVDIASRPGVTQRVLVITPEKPQLAAILFAGGHGGLQIGKDGTVSWGAHNFLVRTQKLFAEKGVMTVLIDSPSDRQLPPYLFGFRQRREHVTDAQYVIAWVRENQPKLPVWLVGTSRGTQSAAYIATELAGKADGPDGLVLTATIMSDKRSRAIPDMPLERLTIPVLVVHHVQDGCSHCSYEEVPDLFDRLSGSRRKEIVPFVGGQDKGDPCEALAHHGFNGLEHDIVTRIVTWMTEKE